MRKIKFKGKLNARKVLLYLYKNGYRVSIFGYLIKDKKRLFTRLDKSGYPTFYTKVQGRHAYLAIHRLQAYQKFGNKIFKKGIEVRHKNGRENDVSRKNILIGTHSTNLLDIPKKLRIKHAEIAASYLRKFNNRTVNKIRKEKKQGLTLRELAIKYNSCKSTMSFIINRKTYK